MPNGLRGRLALFALLGAFLIPFSVSSLRGLTHTLTCQDEVATPFTLIVHESKPPTILTSFQITRGEEEGLCGGLLLDLRAKGEGDKVKMIVLITNNTPTLWKGTVQLVLTGQTKVSVPVDIGAIPAGETAEDTLELELSTGNTEIGGSLLIGP